MLQLRPANERGHFKNHWLDSKHSFSFGEYYDPKQMGISVLRVINDDRITAGAGFPLHPHNNMEIVSYVLEGELAHQDSMGNGSVIRKGEVQRMSAGTGITHSEYNPSTHQGTHFLQIWLLPTQRNTQPSYAQIAVSDAEKAAGWRLLISPDGASGSLATNTEARLYASLLGSGQARDYLLAPERLAYLFVASGSIELAGLTLTAGDGVAFTAGTALKLLGKDLAEVLLFDLPA
ncbi:pirin family protein [Thiothrix eikelboomii]|uniref:pirin family protein n=1 Tax=Thiothrix eikelboomii TaxID=92487 RepID=UPI003BB0940F